MEKLSLLLMLGLLISCAEQDIDQIYQGRYYWGPEVNSFTPCNSESSYWVSYNWAGMEMSNYYKENATAAYQPMYLEFRGHLLNEKLDGFADEYDGLIRLSEAKHYTFDVPPACK